MGFEGFYAVIIVIVVVLASIVCCLGIRLFRRANMSNEDDPRRSPDEWQPLADVSSGPLDADTRDQIQRVLAWQAKHPPRSTDWTDVPRNPLVLERGVGAWAFLENEHMEESEEESNAAVMDKTTIVFCHGQGCTLTNLPLPANEFVYWEVKILQLQDQERLAIGLSTKPYPVWTLPGFHRHSVAYHSHTGAIHTSDPLIGRPYGPPFKQGDVIGVGFLTQTSTVFFTRNGKNLGKASIGFKFPCYPSIGSNGPSQVSVNFGQQDFLFAAANIREAALAPKQDTLPPPPAYSGHMRDTMLFGGPEETISPSHLNYTQQSPSSMQPPPPGYTV
ncbi:concanavalin A-like lectin/glucanase domain-containing protein [Phycomyces nitens]|nr:concanavalin A-like lectin/glucanase domain-containing protein [Phycomyces nitens]